MKDDRILAIGKNFAINGYMHLETTRLPDSYADLKVLTLSLIEALRHKSLEVESLKFQLFQLRRWRFGAQSEQLDAEQLALWQAELEADIAATENKLAEHEPQALAKAEAKGVPKREKLPDWLPRVEAGHIVPLSVGQQTSTMASHRSPMDVLPAA